MVQDYALGLTRVIDEHEFAILTRLSGWTRPDAVPPDTLRALVEARLVEMSTDPVVATHAVPTIWDTWAPEAALLHFATRHGRRHSFEEATRELYATLEIEEYPPVLKSPSGGPSTPLPMFDTQGAMPELLRSRRTWRQFGQAPLGFRPLATLLGLTWGVQQWMRIGPEIRSALKTSPSGGACHSLEAYVVAHRVEDLRPGIYHYDPDAHALRCIRETLPPAPIVTYLGGQPWYREANALCFMTSVIPRVRWKYPSPRAYRSVLLEAGHFCQTFCLVATWLGLAPFCTGQFADALVEGDLGIDGIDETVIYAAGVGSRPVGTDWAPMPEGQRTPSLELPTYRRCGNEHRVEGAAPQHPQPVQTHG
jgi:SagB-type dehydrogenase family enzyme